MSGCISKKIMAEVEAVMPVSQPGMTPGELHGRVGQWAPVTVRHALRQLVEEGRATFTGGHCRRTYWRCGA